MTAANSGEGDPRVMEISLERRSVEGSFFMGSNKVVLVYCGGGRTGHDPCFTTILVYWWWQDGHGPCFTTAECVTSSSVGLIW